MRFAVLYGFGLLTTVVAVAHGEKTKKSCLALVDSKTKSFEESHSKFISIISSNCDTIDVKSIRDKTVQLKKFGEFVYTDLFIGVSDPTKFSFPSTAVDNMFESTNKYRQTTMELQSSMMAAVRHSDESVSGLAIEDVLDFVDNGQNLLIAVQGKKEGKSASSNLVKFLKEFGFGIESSETVIDYFSGSKNSDLVTSSSPLASEPWTSIVCGDEPVSFRGSPISVDKTNVNIFPIIRASETSSHSKVAAQGLSLVLGAAHQTLNGARAVLLGSLDMLSNELVEKNFETIKKIVSWTFGNRAILRIRDFAHHRVGEKEHPRMYREKDDVVVGAKFEQLVGRDNWVPYTADDIQIEYVMMDPHVRDFLKYNAAKTRHELAFRIPDVYGIFKFKIVYNRLGYNPIKFEQVAPVRNYRHNDYERFLFCAYPYYASCFVSLVMVAIVSVLFLNHKDKVVSGKEKRHRE